MRILAPDGIELHAWLIHSKNKKPIATVIQFHGNGENMSSHFLSLAWLTHFNIDVLTFDYRGYGESTGSPNRAGLIQDGVAVVEWAQKNARCKKLFLVGQSLGGAVSVLTYVQNKPKQVEALILESTFASYREITRKKLNQFWLTWPLQWPLSFLVSDELSPIDVIKDVNKPLVFLHSETDPVVPYASGMLLYEAANTPKELWKIPWGGHLSAFVTDDNRFRVKLVEYIKEHVR